MSAHPKLATTRRRHRYGEQGMTLVELVIATAIMSVVVASVAGGIQLMTRNTTTLVQTTASLNQLQDAEQEVVQYLHTATSWCQSPTVSELKFVTNLKGAPKAVDIKIASNNLSLATATSCSGTFSATPEVLLNNVDTSTSTTVTQRSGFSQPNGPTSVTVDGTSYYTSIAVTLTVDSPNVSVSHPTRTSVSDPVVEIWPAEQQCQSSWLEDESGNDPC
jgi:prepilin-type N-terminal cleavage/methylation domain-containing protein